jgi:hypothetical protein
VYAEIRIVDTRRACLPIDYPFFVEPCRRLTLGNNRVKVYAETLAYRSEIIGCRRIARIRTSAKCYRPYFPVRQSHVK